jgi:two-component system, NtrC family, nitrogen regulation sensor histidine kinase NtrY
VLHGIAIGEGSEASLCRKSRTLFVVAVMPGKSEKRLALALLVTSILPLAAAILVANSVLSLAADVWFTPDVGQQLDRSVEIHNKYVKMVKDDMRHQTDAISADEVLRAAAVSRNTELVEVQLDALFPRYPELVALRIVDSKGVVLAERDRGRPVDQRRERSLEVTRILGEGGEPPTLLATFAVDRADVDVQETTGKVVTAYHKLEASRNELYRRYVFGPFAVLAGMMMLLSLVLGTWLARGVTRRMSKLAAAINLVAEGNLDVRVPVTGSDELTDLARTFNHMLDEMETSRTRIEFLQRIGAWQEMARRLAHEIKNPLTPIQLAVQECHRKYGGDDPRFRALLDTTLEVVEEEVGTLRRLVGDFSNFARLPHAELRTATLQDFLKECSEQLIHLEVEGEPEGGAPIEAEALRGSDVEWEIPTEPLPVEIDKQMMRRVLVNLVRNALQAIRDARAKEGTPHDTNRTTATEQTDAPKRSAQVIVSAHADGGGAAILVEDDGPGIPLDQRERVFDPYFTTKRDGTGLGLAIVKKIVVEHGGTISAGSSERLGGAAFVVRLPGPKSHPLAAVREARDRKNLAEGVAPPISAR